MTDECRYFRECGRCNPWPSDLMYQPDRPCRFGELLARDTMANIRKRLNGDENMSLKSLQLIQQFFHDPRYEIAKAKVFYVERGAPDDSAEVMGTQIAKPDGKFWFGVITPEKCIKEIPYHRIYRIEYDGKCLFERCRMPATDQNLVFGSDFLHDCKVKRTLK